MIDNGVSAFFHGHDHQYAYEVRDGIVYQSTPQPNSTLNFNYYSESDPYTERVLSNPGHLRVTVTPSQTTVEYITSNGSSRAVQHSYTILPHETGTTHDLTMAVSPGGGGTTTPAVGVHSYGEGTVVPLSATPAAGYVFDHWSGDVTGSANPTTVTMSAAKAVTAVFTVQTHDLTMAVSPGGGGTTTPAVGVHSYGEGTVVPLSATPAAGYVFDHWSGDVTGSANPTTVTMSAAKAVTAQFVKTYTLTYIEGTGGTITGDKTQTVDSGADGTLVTAVANAGYRFDKWSDDVTTATRTDLNVTADKTVTAQFVKTYTLTYIEGTGGTITGDKTQTVDSGADGTLVTAVANAGYRFDKWSDDVTTATRTDTDVTADLSVTATFAIDTHAVSASAPGGHGTITPALVNNIDYGSPSGDFTITPATGYHLASLTDNGADVFGSVVAGKYSIASVTQDHTLVATFAIDTHAVSASAPGGHGTITPALVSNIDYGSPSGDFTITPATGYHLVSLTDNGADVFGSVVAGKYSIASVTQDHTLVATFAIDTHAVSASAPGGHGTITPALVNNIDYGSPSGDFTITPATGYHLVSLTDNGADVFGSVVAGKYSIASVTQDHTLVATFAIDTHAVSASAPGGHGTITPALVNNIDYGSPSGDFTITPATGYHLVSLTDNGADVFGSVVAASTASPASPRITPWWPPSPSTPTPSVSRRAGTWSPPLRAPPSRATVGLGRFVV